MQSFYLLYIAILMLFCITVYSQSSDFYANYTRLDFDDNNNTGKYADIVVNVNKHGQLVFSREYSYLPYWQTNKSKSFVERIIPFHGDGPAGRPDRRRCHDRSRQSPRFALRYAPSRWPPSSPPTPSISLTAIRSCWRMRATVRLISWHCGS